MYSTHLNRNWDEMQRIAANRTIHLQSVGKQFACRIDELQEDWFIQYNFGYVERIKFINPVSRISREITTEDDAGREFTRTRRNSTLVGFIIEL